MHNPVFKRRAFQPQNLAPPPNIDAAYLAEEIDKIETLKAALFVALQSSPANALPLPLIDLATTYSRLLTQQMALMTEPPPPTPAISPAPKLADT